MMTKLSQERLGPGHPSATVVETVLDWTVEYTSDRSVFGPKARELPDTQFKLADLKTKATVARVFTDRCISLFMEGKLDPVTPRGQMFTPASLRAGHECPAIVRRVGLYDGVSDRARL